MSSGNLRTVIFAALLLDAALLGAGLFGTCMTVYPGFGGYESLVEIFAPESTSPRSFSIAQSIRLLAGDGQYFIAAVLFVFSALFPVWKLGVLWNASRFAGSEDEAAAEVRWVETLGKYSMIDIFVLALFVVALKGLPGGTSVRIGWALYCFFASILISMLLPGVVKRSRKLTAVSSARAG